MYNEGIRTYTAGEALAAHRRVKIEGGTTTTPPEVVYADAGEQHIGVTEYAVDDGDLVAIRLRTYPGSVEVEAADTFSIGAVLYGATDGKISDSSSGSAIGIAHEACTGAGDIVEMIPFAVLSTTAGTVSIVDGGGFTSETTVEAALQEIYPKAPVAIVDPGDGNAVPVTKSGSVAITTGGAETRTIAIPGIAGIAIAISLDVDGGDCVITVAAAINQTGNNTITMNDAGDTIVLIAVQVASALVWRMVVNDGCTLSTV